MGWLDPFAFPFMQNAMLAALLLAPATALLSTFLVLKGWSLMGDAISHAVLPGIVLAYIAGLPLILGAFLAGIFCSVSIGYLDANSRVKRDTVMGVVFSGMFGLGLVMFAWVPTNVHLDHILFGNLLGVGRKDVWLAAVVGIGVAAVFIVKWKDFLLHAFDPAQARAVGLPVGWLHYGLMVILSLTVVAVLKTVGLILAIGLMIAPGAIAFLITREFRRMMWVAVVVNLVAMLGGIYLSFWIDASTGATIILLLTIAFVAAFLWRGWRARRVVANG